MNILVVDDNQVNLKLYARLIKKHDLGVATCFTSSNEALDWTRAHEADLIIVDYSMPSPNGIEFISIFRSIDDKHQQVPVLMVTADHAKEIRYAALQRGASDFLTKPLDAAEFCARVRNMLALSESQRQLAETANWLAEQVKLATAEIASRERETIIKLSAAAERRDPDTGVHVMRMAYYCQAIARGIGLSNGEQELMLAAAPLHDIGKIAIPDAILLKPGKLNPQEFAVMKQHTVVGFEMLKDTSSKLLLVAAEIALTHHEKYDGSGYPYGLHGEQIPLVGRICAVSDVFDALCSERPYKHAWPVNEAVEEINRCSGTHFDPQLVDVFNEALPELLEVSRRFLDRAPGRTRATGTR